MITITADAGKICIRLNPPDATMIAAIKEIPGRRWDSVGMAWYAPATSTVAAAVAEKFGRYSPGTNAAFRELVAESRAAVAAQCKKTADEDQLAQPVINKIPLWLHQLRAYNFVFPLRAAMLDMRMGTGKSAVVVNVAINRGHKRVIIVGPKTVIDGECVLVPGGDIDTLAVWAREFYRHAGHDRWRCWNDSKGTCAERAKKMTAFLKLCEIRGEVAVVLMNYEAIWRDDMARAVMGAGFDFCVCDESHKIKSPSGAASKFFERFGAKVPWRLCLTGTPTPHSPLDIYAQYRFLDRGVFGTSFTVFRARYATMGGYGGHEVKGYQNVPEYRERVDLLAYHCGDEMLDLPEAVHTYRTVELSDKARKIYAQMEKTFVADIEAGRITASNALSKLLRLQQITSSIFASPRHFAQRA